MPFTLTQAQLLSTQTQVPFAPEINAKYTLTGPNGIIATFNDPTDADWCGTLTNVTGLDSADVRESGDVFAQTDGGWHGNFWYGRRPITLEGTCLGNPDAETRAIKLDQIKKATNAMQADATLSWLNTAAGSVQMQTWVRRQQPVRFTGGWNKNFQIQLISQYAPLFSTAVHVATGTNLNVINIGDYPSAGVIRIQGPTTDPVIRNATTGTILQFLTGLSISTGHYVDVDILNHTAIQDSLINISSQIDFNATTWPALVGGSNNLVFTQGSGSGSITITYRDMWA